MRRGWEKKAAIADGRLPSPSMRTQAGRLLERGPVFPPLFTGRGFSRAEKRERLHRPHSIRNTWVSRGWAPVTGSISITMTSFI